MVWYREWFGASEALAQLLRSDSDAESSGRSHVMNAQEDERSEV
ncbi:MAG: hypothetical protein PHR78_02600 [Eubacteriales bacterium]|nr:hypothetical protein [Eubacteriales bacterium]MDD4541043.1 hypothetical protein [Eubacteriales bacterium]